MAFKHDSRRVIFLLATLVLALGAGSARAAGSSVTAGAFSSLPVSVRGAGMGGAYVALAERGGAPYHNPARMGFAEERNAGMSYADLSGLGLVRNVYLDYSQPDQGYGASGLYWNWRGAEVEGPLGEGELGYAENTIAYALGKRLGEYVAVGFAVKGYFISTDIDNAGGKGGGLDLALFARPDPFSTVGLVVRNAFSRVAWDTGTDQTLPLEVELGGSYEFLDGLRGVLELRFEKDSYSSLILGGEYALLPETVDLRAGVQRRFDRTSPAFGLGFRHDSFRVDYAADIDAGHAGLGTTHRLGLSLDF